MKRKQAAKLLLVAILAVGFYFYFSSGKSTSTAAPKEVHLEIGHHYVLRTSESNGRIISNTPEEFDRTSKMGVGGDTEGVALELLNGRIFMVNDGTPVVIVDKSYTISQVRIENGNT